MPLAKKDMNNIFNYIANDSIGNANKLLKKFYKTFESLEFFPFMYKKCNKTLINVDNYRAVHVGNYLIFYKIISKNIFIMRIIHSKRNYKFLLK